MSSNEIRRLFAKLILTAQHTATHVLAWSDYRQACTQRARTTHYRKRLEHLQSDEPP